MRVIARRERPHPGAQLRLTDADGHRITCVATNHPGPHLPDLEARHRRRARVENRIREAEDAGLHNLPFHDAASNQIWIEIVLLAQLLLSATQQLALHDEHKVAEPKKIRLHLRDVAARLITSARRRILHYDKHCPLDRDHRDCDQPAPGHRRTRLTTRPPSRQPSRPGPGNPATGATAATSPARTRTPHPKQQPQPGRHRPTKITKP